MSTDLELIPDPTAFRPLEVVASRDIEVGQEIATSPKHMTLDKARIYVGWPTLRNRHSDYEAAHSTGWRAPALDGAQTAAVLGELYIKFFGEQYLGGSLAFNLIGQVQLDDTLTAKGVVKEKTPEGDRVKLVLDVWVENQRGEKILVGTATGYAP
jgi:acyl dehydratase